MRKLTSGLLVLIGALWTLKVAPVVASVGGAYFRAGAAPAPAKVADAPQERWIRLEDARVRCDTRSVRRGFTYFVADAVPGGGPPFVAQLSGDVRCEDAVLDGGFAPGRFTRSWFKQNTGLDVPGDDLRLFSQTLSPRYLRGVLALSVALLVAGLAVLATGIGKLRRALRPAAD